MKRSIKLLLICCMGMTVFWSSTMLTGAFLRKPLQPVTNVITAGEISIKLEEPDWKEERGVHILPRKVLKKNPMIKNTGKNECRVFLEIKNPIKEIILVDHETKKKLPKERSELFSFTPSAEWMLLDKKEEADICTYLFVYTDILPPGKSTKALFNEITFVNYLEGEIGAEEQVDMVVNAAAIQVQAEEKGFGWKELYHSYFGKETENAKEAESEI